MTSILFGIWAFVIVGNLIMQLALVLSARYELRMMREAGDDFTIVKKPINLGALIRLMFITICPLLNIWLLVGTVISFDDAVEAAIDNIVEF